tara:strand:+ start:466 stop:675 length:210 start_codon:yes stop_codon:yes gene_type:complete
MLPNDRFCALKKRTVRATDFLFNCLYCEQITGFLHESFKMAASEQFLYKKGLTQANESVKCTPQSRRGG